MPTITLSVPEDLKHEMDALPEINWSAVAREAIRIKVAEIALFRSIVSKSKLTEEDVLELGSKINKGLAERYKELMRKKCI